MAGFSFPENCKLISGAAPQVGTNADVNSTPISVKLFHRVWIVVYLNPAAAAYTLTPQTDTLVAFGSAAGLTNVVRIWYNANVAASDTLVEQTPALVQATDADGNDKIVIFEIDPSDLAAGEDCIRVNIPALAIGDYASVLYVCEPRYPSRVATSPTGLTN